MAYIVRDSPANAEDSKDLCIRLREADEFFSDDRIYVPFYLCRLF